MWIGFGVNAMLRVANGEIECINECLFWYMAWIRILAGKSRMAKNVGEEIRLEVSPLHQRESTKLMQFILYLYSIVLLLSISMLSMRASSCFCKGVSLTVRATQNDAKKEQHLSHLRKYSAASGQISCCRRRKGQAKLPFPWRMANALKTPFKRTETGWFRREISLL